MEIKKMLSSLLIILTILGITPKIQAKQSILITANTSYTIGQTTKIYVQTPSNKGLLQYRAILKGNGISKELLGNKITGYYTVPVYGTTNYPITLNTNGLKAGKYTITIYVKQKGKIIDTTTKVIELKQQEKVITGKEFIEGIYTTLNIKLDGKSIIDKSKDDYIIPAGLDITKPIKREDAAQILFNVINTYQEVKDKIVPVSMEVKSGREVELWRYKQEWWDRENDFERIIYTVPYDVDMQNFQMITYTYKDGHKVVKYSWNAIRNGRKVMEVWNNDKTKPLACPSLNDEFYNLLIMQGRMMPEDQVRFRLLYKDYNQISTNRREAVEKIADLGLMNGYFIPTKGDKPIYEIYDWKTSKKLNDFNSKYDASKNLVYFYPKNALKETEFNDVKNRLKNENLRLCDDEFRFNFITDYELRFHYKNPILRIYDVRTVYYFKNIINTTKNDKNLIIYNILSNGHLGHSFESKQLQKSYFIPYPLP